VNIKRRGISTDGSKVERRKSQRFPVAVPVEASWREADGKAAKENAIGRHVNAQGGMLEMVSYPEIGSRVTLTNFFSAETAEARVLATPYSREGVSHGIVVELTVPSETFWGVSMQVKKAGVELAKLEKMLQSEGIDLRLLREYRDAVDCVRTAALAVRELRERQLDGRDDGDVALSLAAIRIRRSTNICLELIADLDAGKIGPESNGVEELQRALDQTRTRVNNLLKRKVPEGKLLPEHKLAGALRS
jgi:hypothetical protein